MRSDDASMAALSDCDKCMKSTTQATRQQLGCGFEPAIENPTPWRPRSYSGADITTCAGYTTRLPVVIEVARARVHWMKGIVPKPFTEGLQRGLEELDNAVHERDAWNAKNPRKAT